MSKTNQTPETERAARAVAFGRINDPYIIFHADALALSDERLKSLFDEWRGSNGAPGDDEDFEVFLDWLEAEKDYGRMRTADEIFEFERIAIKDDEPIPGDVAQCGSCETIFREIHLTAKSECPFCFSGNWVRGLIDG